MPAMVKSRVGSSCGTTGDEGTNVCPCFLTKKSMNCWRISLAVTIIPSQKTLPRTDTDRHGDCNPCSFVASRGFFISLLGLRINFTQRHALFPTDAGTSFILRRKDRRRGLLLDPFCV